LLLLRLLIPKLLLLLWLCGLHILLELLLLLLSLLLLESSWYTRVHTWLSLRSLLLLVLHNVLHV
jgi:hypothetical protein